MYKLCITEPAELDITEAVLYIAKELKNPVAASRLLDDVESAVNSLEFMPRRHALVNNDYMASLGFRSLAVHNYLVFYIVREDTKTVTIERILYNRREWLHIIEQLYPIIDQ